MCVCDGILFSHREEDIQQLVTTWMNLGHTMLSDISQKEKEKYSMISHVEAKKAELIDPETRMVVN